MFDSSRSLSVFLCLVGGLAILAAGCGEQVGGFTVSTPSLAGRHPLAAGTTWTVRVERIVEKFPDTQATRCEQVNAATSTDPDVVRVVEKGGCEVTLEGVAPGAATVEFKSDDRSGAFDVRVAALDRVTVGHTCTDGQEAAYLAGGEVLVQYRLVDGRGRALFGDRFPIGFSPPESVEVTAHHPGTGLAALKLVDEPREVTVEPEIEGRTLTMQVIDAAGIDAVETELETGDDALSVGRTASFWVNPRAGGLELCQWDGAELTVEVDSATPSVCSVRPVGTGDDGEAASEWVVEGLKAGSCRLEAALPGAAGGDGLETSATVEITSGGS